MSTEKMLTRFELFSIQTKKDRKVKDVLKELTQSTSLLEQIELAKEVVDALEGRKFSSIAYSAKEIIESVLEFYNIPEISNNASKTIEKWFTDEKKVSDFLTS